MRLRIDLRTAAMTLALLTGLGVVTACGDDTSTSSGTGYSGSGGYTGTGTGTGTGGNTGSGTTGGGQSSAITTSLVIDSRGCQQIRTTGPITVADIPGLYCYRSLKGAPTLVDVYLQTNQTNPVFRQDFNPQFSGYDVRYWYSTQMWTRAPSGQAGPVDLCWRTNTSAACQWVSPAVYGQLVDQQLQIQRLNQQQAAQAKVNADAVAEANRAEAQRQLNLIKTREIEATKIFTAPECVHSYNGCGY